MRIQGIPRGKRPRKRSANARTPQSALREVLLPPALTPAPLAAGKALRITDANTTEGLQRLVALSIQLGVPIQPQGPDAADDPQETFHMEVDDQGDGIALEHVRGLAEQPRVVALSGVSADALQELRDQHRELVTLDGDAEKLEEGLDRARRVFGAVQRQSAARLITALDGLLLQPGLDPQKRARLLGYQATLKAQEEKIKAEQQAQADKTKAATAAGKAKLEQAQRELDGTRAFGDLKAGRPADEEALGELVDLHEAEQGPRVSPL